MRLLATVGLLLAGLVGACGGAAPAKVAAVTGGGTVSTQGIPAALVGYTIQPEDVSKQLKEAGGKAYVSDVKLWSLREGDRLRGTIEVGRFAPDAPPTDVFKRRVADQVGQAAPRLRRIGTQLVYVSAGTRQTYYMWFSGISFVLVGVPADAVRPRAILRAALEQVRP